MGLGILEYRGKLQHVPGTVYLDTHSAGPENVMSNLKKGKGKDSEVILVPQPSNDPNDPLNWPLWQRDCILLLYCFCTLVCTGGVGPILSSMVIPLATEFRCTFTKISLLLGYNLCAVGAVGIFISAFCCKYGKRPSMIASMASVLAGSIWAGLARSYGSMVGARVVQGLGIAMFESITFAIVGDLYHVHQRGSRMGLYVLAQSGIANIPAVAAGKITMDLGWRYVFYLLSIFAGIGFLLSLFFGWETMFIRNELYNIDTSSQNNIETIQELKGGASVSHQEPGVERTLTSTTDIVPPREKFFRRMKLFHGSFSDDSLWKIVIRPVYVLLNPVVLWSILVISFTSVWIIGVSILIAQIFAPPPFLLDTAQLGYMGAGPVIGGLLGCIICGSVSDPIARWLTRRNNGTYEPEFRLPMIVGMPVISAISYFLLGNLINGGYSAIVASALWGLAFVTVQIAAVATGGYVVDAFRNVSVEIFIISMTAKNFIWFGFSFFLNDWLATVGVSRFFNTIGAIQICLSLTTIPVYIYGKKIRAWWHLHNVIESTHSS